MEIDQISDAIGLARNAKVIDGLCQKVIDAILSASGTHGSTATFVQYAKGGRELSLIATAHRQSVLVDFRNAILFEGDRRFLVGKVVLSLVESGGKVSDIHCDIKIVTPGNLVFDGRGGYSLTQISERHADQIKDDLSSIILVGVQGKLPTAT